MKIELPWPPRVLSPNARCHWSTKAKAVKKFRAECKVLAGKLARVLEDKEVRLTFTFHPPTKRRRDLDNVIASCKGLQDGLADAWGVDDRHFVPTYRMGEVCAGGKVVVEVFQDAHQ